MAEQEAMSTEEMAIRTMQQLVDLLLAGACVNSLSRGTQGREGHYALSIDISFPESVREQSELISKYK